MNRLIDHFGMNLYEFFGNSKKDSWKFGAIAPSSRLAFGFPLRPETSKVDTSVLVANSLGRLTVKFQFSVPLVGFVFKEDKTIATVTTEPFVVLRFQDTDNGITSSVINSFNELYTPGLNEAQSKIVCGTLISESMVARTAIRGLAEADFHRVFGQ